MVGEAVRDTPKQRLQGDILYLGLLSGRLTQPMSCKGDTGQKRGLAGHPDAW